MTIEEIKTKLKIIVLAVLISFYGMAYLIYKYPGRDYIKYGDVSYLDILSSVVNFVHLVLPPIVTFVGRIPERVNYGLSYLVEGPSCGTIPPKIVNCEIKSQWMTGANGFIEGDWVLYTSNVGYTVEDKDKAICGNKGEWIHLPKCTPLSFAIEPPYEVKGKVPKLKEDKGTTRDNGNKKIIRESVEKVPIISYLHGDNKVFEISTQQRKLLKDVKVGDQFQAIDKITAGIVLTSVTNIQYFPDEELTFYSIQLKTGHKLHGLTEDQYIHILSDNHMDNVRIMKDRTLSNIDKIIAKKVKIGQIVVITFDNQIGQPGLGEVVSVETFKDSGAYSVKTKHNNLFVNGINIQTE